MVIQTWVNNAGLRIAGHNLFLLKHSQMVQPLHLGWDPQEAAQRLPCAGGHESLVGAFPEGEGTATACGVYVSNSQGFPGLVKEGASPLSHCQDLQVPALMMTELKARGGTRCVPTELSS